MARLTKRERIVRDCKAHLWDISRLFPKGTKLTLVARPPNANAHDLLITGDSLEEIVGVFDRIKMFDKITAPQAPANE